MEGKKATIVLTVGGVALALFYIFQHVNYGLLFFRLLGAEGNEVSQFILNKTFRLLVNDSICFAMIYLIFTEPKSRALAVWVLALELVIILPLYLSIKLTIEGVTELSMPLLSFVHRLVINPMLMVLTMIALGYQKFVSS